MKFKGSQLIQDWSQDKALKEVGVKHGMCIVFAFYFGALRMRSMNLEFAMGEILKLDSNRKPLLDIFKKIYDDYSHLSGNYCDEIDFIARQFVVNQIVPEIDFTVNDYDNFNIEHQSFYPNGLHAQVAEDIQNHYLGALHSSGYLMIGMTMKGEKKHATTLIYTPDDKYYFFDPNLGLYQLLNLNDFFNEYGKLSQIIEWDLVMVKAK